MPPVTTNSLRQLAVAIALSSVSGMAWAADCTPFLAPPPQGVTDFEVSMVTMSNASNLLQSSVATYAWGKIAYRPGFIIPPGIPRPAVWSTPQPANYLTDLNSILRAKPIPQSTLIQGFAGVQITVTAAAAPQITLKYLSSGIQYQLTGTCSAGGIIYATPTVRFLPGGRRPIQTDFMIYIRRGEQFQ
jgi:hypothetical protein